MSVTAVHERHEGRRSSIRDGKTTHTRVYIVHTDSIADGTAVAIKAAGIPRYGHGHPGDADLKVTSIDADPIKGSGTHFEVKVEYGDDDTTFVFPTSPLDRPPEVSWSGSEAAAPYFLDRSNPPKPVTNSAGDPFEQFLERETGELVITITLNEAAFDAAVADTYSHTINAGPVRIDTTTFAAETLKLSPIQATKVKERVEEEGAVQDFTYYRITYQLKARAEGWIDRPLDVGLNERIGNLADGFKLKPIVDAANLPVKKPYPLDGEGRRRISPTDEPAELEFRPYKLRSWDALKFTDPTIWQ
ncbi:MAG: hypothetical protein AAF656_00465 [Planctomycetota bacterium]